MTLLLPRQRYCRKIAAGIRQRLIIDDEWLPYEIHPDTPAEGVRLDEYFPGMNTALFLRRLIQRAKRYDLFFGPQEVMSNSRLALMGGEFAKEHGCYHQYHEAVFKAFSLNAKHR